ncbi:hypothetical protein NC661_11720 [Aquibacillus koreensis]|uniref:Uncharacterized protein n=1 Tax=Aquibacillus koreensis TaxID=279446 RepID=A0A9X3WPL2_9BACI|nr:hypothetical protein [Aquibacillus koreensis]MCT2535180.1 hypothetical protein [Aquibacillus koreensis]MDC3421039.1 hypothetical protein [Aquibacillus koreensis]
MVFIRKTYFISVDAGRLDKEKLDDNRTYFQVEAEGHDLYDLKYLLNQVKASDKSAKPVISQPLSESKIDNKRDAFQQRLEKLYEKIYQLGTEETRASIRSLGILNQNQKTRSTM